MDRHHDTRGGRYSALHVSSRLLRLRGMGGRSSGGCRAGPLRPRVGDLPVLAVSSVHAPYYCGDFCSLKTTSCAPPPGLTVPGLKHDHCSGSRRPPARRRRSEKPDARTRGTNAVSALRRGNERGGKSCKSELRETRCGGTVSRTMWLVSSGESAVSAECHCWPQRSCFGSAVANARGRPPRAGLCVVPCLEVSRVAWAASDLLSRRDLSSIACCGVPGPP